MATAVLTGYANAQAVIDALDAAGTSLQPGDLATLAGAIIGGYRVGVVSSVSGNLTTADHSGKHLVTSGNVTVPNAAGDVGFTAIIEAGGAHTVTFNSTTSAALATGDLMNVTVKSTSVIIARKSAAGAQVAFT